MSTGWNLPPGCSDKDVDGDPPCTCCEGDCDHAEDEDCECRCGQPPERYLPDPDDIDTDPGDWMV